MRGEAGPAGFDAGGLARHYSFIERCDDRLLASLLALTEGPLEERVAGISAWRAALLAGTLPRDASWPSAPVQAPVRAFFERTGLQRFCVDNAPMVEELLHEITEAFGRRTCALGEEVAAELRRLERLEAKRASSPAGTPSERLETRSREDLRREAERTVHAHARSEADRELIDAWEPRVRLWTELEAVFGPLGHMLGRGFDLSAGVLRHVGWKDMFRLRALAERIPELSEVVRTLGRLQDGTDGESTAETVLAPLRRLEQERSEVHTPLAPEEVRGLERSGEIDRMLPVESVALGHPTLKWLWHARRAERALLTYLLEDAQPEFATVERVKATAQLAVRPRPIRGPILAVIDTSGSMNGLPERVAKAVVLETLRAAHEEQRRCVVWQYSGPGDVAELELELTERAIGSLLKFLAQSFHGGNDEPGVLRRVLDRLNEADYQRADVLFVSDGVWPAPTEFAVELVTARERGARLHGLQIGTRGRTGLHSICDPVHVFHDWAALARER